VVQLCRQSWRPVVDHERGVRTGRREAIRALEQVFAEGVFLVRAVDVSRPRDNNSRGNSLPSPERD
jgi:hypothetical protein